MSRFKLMLLSALAVLAVGAVASSTASAALHYYNASGVRLTLGGAPLLVDATGGTQTLKGVAGGLPIEISCAALDSHGLIENPAGGGAGKTLVGLLYLTCNVTPASLECKIPGGMITTSVNGVLEGTGAAPVVQFSPDPSSSSIFVKIPFEKCKNAGLNTEFPVEGSALGKINNTLSTVKVEEVKGSASMLKFGGNEAGLTGEETVEMTGGGKIEVKE